MRRLGCMVALMAAAVLGGCSGDDDKNPTKPPPVGIVEPISPQNVLHNLLLSYQNRDSTEYKSIYDSSYTGTSTDLNDPPGSQLLTFRYADEVAHIAALARSTSIISVVLDFGPSSSWTRLASEDPSHPEWAVIQVAYVHGEINDVATTVYSFQSVNPMIFAFTPTVAAPGDTTWKIIRWTEIGQGA